MATRILKPEFFTMQPETPATSPFGLGEAMLLLNQITGAILAGIGVVVLFANVLLGCVSLFLGLDFPIGLLAQ